MVRGFTLMELLMVIVILSLMAVTVFVAINPAKRLADARDARRRADVENILTAIHTYVIDNGGNLPVQLATRAALPAEWQLGNSACTGQITTGGCTTTVACGGVSCCVDLSSDLSKYLRSIPVDPLGGQNTSGNTGYAISWTSTTPYIITIKACRAEGTNISQSR